MRSLIFLFSIILLNLIGLYGQTKKELKMAGKVIEKLEKQGGIFPDFTHLGSFYIDSVLLERESKIIELFFNPETSYIPFREPIIAEEECRLKSMLGRHFRHYKLRLYAGRTPLGELVPNYFRTSIPLDSSHFAGQAQNKGFLYRRLFQDDFPGGLTGKHIALWHSHGRYYESKLDRWEWQRARLHGTVEDLLPMSFVLPFLSKMLENAGAITLIPRERDTQTKEVIVDHDVSTGQSFIDLNTTEFDFEKKDHSGFLWKESYQGTENPFSLGSCLMARIKGFPDEASASKRVASYVPDIPVAGKYAVYISYGKNNPGLEPVKYVVKSLQGTHAYQVDQSMGAGTWIYLGHYFFERGTNEDEGRVIVYSDEPASLISLDAVRFGGGMGNIARRPAFKSSPNEWSLKGQNKEVQEIQKGRVNEPSTFDWKVSGDARYMEAARYYLQYAGMPDSLVYNLNGGKNDYNDDYQSRGEWVNYLMGTPKDPLSDTNTEGLGIPVDAALAFHTDAGVTNGDSIIGTLGIYSTEPNEGTFPSKRSRMVSRELSDLIQTQIVDDIRTLFEPSWTRRGLWDRPYSEAYRANVPTMLLELLSHQNLADMQYALDPRFRFHVSRAIYKGMLRFLCFQDARIPVVQPLPVSNFCMQLTAPGKIKLSWSAVPDPLEASALPDHYELYMREENGAFRLVPGRIDTNQIELELPFTDKLFSFRVVPVNSGGAGFPSEILSAGFPAQSLGTVLVINAFDRVSGPAHFDQGEMAGFANWLDQGVPWETEMCITGEVYDFSRHSPWLDDDSPGWGASHADWEGRLIPGNDFDQARIHGKALMANGYGFFSTSDEAMKTALQDTTRYSLVDVIFGEEKSEQNIRQMYPTDFRVLSKDMIETLANLTEMGVPLFLSGAHIGSDMVHNNDSLAIRFAKEKLHYSWRTDHADRRGSLFGTEAFQDRWKGEWTYNAGYHPAYYTVESPDAIEPSGAGAETVIRYRQTRASAAVAYRGKFNRLVSMGFPFESVLSAGGRNDLMARILRYLLVDR